MNKGTRQFSQLYGDGSLFKEFLACAIEEVHGYWTVQNPQASVLWHIEFRRFFASGAVKVDLGQCVLYLHPRLLQRLW